MCKPLKFSNLESKSKASRPNSQSCPNFKRWSDEAVSLETQLPLYTSRDGLGAACRLQLRTLDSMRKLPVNTQTLAAGAEGRVPTGEAGSCFFSTSSSKVLPFVPRLAIRIRSKVTQNTLEAFCSARVPVPSFFSFPREFEIDCDESEAVMKFNKQSGQVLIGTAFALIILAGFAGLAIDMGTMRYERRLQQTAADAAALAGASNLVPTCNGCVAAAQTASTSNGYADSGSQDLSNCAAGAAVGTTCVQVVHPPADVTFDTQTIPGGPHAGNNDYVEVIVAKVQPTYFMKVFGVDSKTITARAVATNTGGGIAGGGGCIYTLGTPSKQLNFNK